MKKLLATIAILLVFVGTLPLSAFAEESVTDTTAETAADTFADTSNDTTPESTPLCTCSETPASAYCPVCGGLNPAYAKDRWDCVSCGKQDNTTPFCPQCGERHPDTDRFWTCPSCEQKDNFTAACHRCGASRPDKDSGTKFKIDASTLSDTLPIMGMGMLGIFLVIGAIAVAVMILRKLPEKNQE